MKSLVQTYKFIEKLIPGALFVSIFLVMLMEIFSRLILRKSFEWNTEYCRYALVWVTFIGAIYVRRENTHIEVAALYQHCRDHGNRGVAMAMDVVRGLVSLLFWGFLAWYGWLLSNRIANFTSSAMDISQFWLYISSSICGVMGLGMELAAFFELLSDIARGTYGARRGE